MLNAMLSAINNFMYSYLLIIMLVGLGLFFTIRYKFVQFRLLGDSIKVLKEKKSNKKSVSALEALLTSTAVRVGTGNIIGVSTAICIGGYGAVFWMWLTAILGSATSFVECTLSQLYKKKDGQGGYYGGPSYYIEAAMGKRWLGVVFALCTIFTFAGGFSMLPAYNLQSTYTVFAWHNPQVTPWIIGTILALATAFCLLGGGRRIIKANNFLVPIMGAIYLLVCLIALLTNLTMLPSILVRIFTEAFDFQAIFGGFMSSCIMLGVKRGLLSNEAGIGAGPHIAAAAETSHPAKQGATQILSVMLDTLVICSATAFLCFFSGVEPVADLAGAPYVQAAVRQLFGGFGPVFVSLSVTLFGFTSIIGNYYLVDSCVAYLCKKWPSQAVMNTIHIAGSLLVLVGTVLPFGTIWDLTDVSMGLMAIVNLPVILLLGKPVIKTLEHYLEQKKAGLDPTFRAAEIGLENTECWK